MGWRKYFALALCRQHRYPIAIDVEFYVWDGVVEKPLTGKAAGRLVDISIKEARLQTNTVRIGNHHLIINNNLEGKTPLILEFPLSPEGMPWALKSQILWYNRISVQGKFKFEFGVGFFYISTTQQERLESFLKSI